MSYEEQMREVNAQRKAESDLRRQRYNESSKQHLSSIIETKLRTAFIAPLSYFEEQFGYLWGHGKKDSELTAEELRFRNIWIILRTKILNNGNNQIRAILSELVQYTITWNRYQKKFINSGTSLKDEEKLNVRQEENQ